MLPRLIYAVLISLTLVAISVAQQRYQPEVAASQSSTCRDPEGQEGNCVALRDCEPLIKKLYAKKNDDAFILYLRASNRICQSAGTAICCPRRRLLIGSNVWGRAPTRTLLSPAADTIQSNVRHILLPTERDGCGYTSKIFLKFVDSEVNKIGGWPWAAILGYDDKSFKCGGTLVTKRHVITAAHCVRKDLNFVRLGEHDLSVDTETKHIDIRVVKAVVHPNYDGIRLYNDIAVLYLEHDVQFTALIAPICLPTAPEYVKKSYITYNPFVIGWGKTLSGGESSNTLQELQITVHKNDVCIDLYRKENLFDNRTLSESQLDASVICAGVLVPVCRGDEGSPLMIPEVYNGNYRFYLLGVASYGVGCGKPKAPALYTSVQYFIDWIVQTIAGSQ